MRRVWNRFFGSRRRAFATMLVAALVVAAIRPDWVAWLVQYLAESFILAVGNLLNAVLYGASRAIRRHEHLASALVQWVIVILIVYWLLRRIWRGLFGGGRRRR